MPVNVPQAQQKPGMLGQVGQIGGAIVGGVMGGPAGAAAGASIGSTVGGMADANMSKPQQSTGAIERRALLQADPQTQIAQSQEALAQLPPDQQKQYGPILRRAQQMGATA